MGVTPFYSFKAGYKSFARLFAYGILKAIRNHPQMARLKYDRILGVPLSPRKKEDGEFDRVSELCKIISKELGVPYVKTGLSLSKSISRRSYKLMGKGREQFVNRYSEYLHVKTFLKNKKVLLIDDVVTDGLTLRTVTMKILERYPSAVIYGATAGIMAKQYNMTSQVIRKFSQ
jgi:predicted amidophosphoribosyltransferase